MSANVHVLSTPATSQPEPDTTRQPYSFDMTQIDQRGMVLIDACVPAPMATAFLQMLIAFQEAAKT